MVILETVPSFTTNTHWLVLAFENFTVYTFAFEYMLRLWASVEDPRIGAAHPVTGRVRFALRPMTVIDFLAFAPHFITLVTGGALDLRALRILRLLRLLKIARYSQAMPAMLGVLYAERRALLGSFILLLCTVCIAGEMMHLVEGQVQPKFFGTLPGSMYWAIATLSTVGYGDEVPITMLGKLVAGVTMVVGLVLFAMPIGIIATGFVNGLHRREFTITWSMVKRQPLFGDFDVDAVSPHRRPDGRDAWCRSTPGSPFRDRRRTFYLIISGRARAEDDERLLGPGGRRHDRRGGARGRPLRQDGHRPFRNAADGAAGRGAAAPGPQISVAGAAGEGRDAMVEGASPAARPPLGRAAVVTGSTSGIGLAIARALAARGRERHAQRLRRAGGDRRGAGRRSKPSSGSRPVYSRRRHDQARPRSRR